MKRWLLFITSCFLLTGCAKLNELTQFEFSNSMNFTIPASTVVQVPFNILTPSVETNSSGEFSSHDTRADLIEVVTLKNCVLKITSPPSGNFDFLEDLEIYISSTGQSEKLIAYKRDIQDGIGNVLELEATNENLKDFLTKESYKLRIYTVTDQALGSDVDIEVENTFFVDAKLL